MRWVQGGEYDRIVRGEYRRRDQETDVREEAGDAMEFYAERFRAMFREVGDNITNARLTGRRWPSRPRIGSAGAAARRAGGRRRRGATDSGRRGGGSALPAARARSRAASRAPGTGSCAGALRIVSGPEATVPT